MSFVISATDRPFAAMSPRRGIENAPFSNASSRHSWSPHVERGLSARPVEPGADAGQVFLVEVLGEVGVHSRLAAHPTVPRRLLMWVASDNSPMSFLPGAVEWVSGTTSLVLG